MISDKKNPTFYNHLMILLRILIIDRVAQWGEGQGIIGEDMIHSLVVM